MTLEEAQEVAAIAVTADGGCGYCARDLLAKLQESFPQFVWTWTGSEAAVGTPAGPEAEAEGQ